MSAPFRLQYTDFVFDLDDTILDTSGVLIPLATEIAVQKMHASGLTLLPRDAAKVREEILLENPRAYVFKEIALRYTPQLGSETKSLELKQQELESIGLQAFLSPPLEILTALSASAFVPGADRLLDFLSTRARLHLVTAGLEAIQIRKVEALGIKDLFQAIHVVAPERGSKLEAYRSIRSGTALEAKVLVVGNRVDTDLAPGKALGFRTAWIRHGEHRHVEPQTSDEIPDFEFRTPDDLYRFLHEECAQ